jgi:hypothetical protein
VRRQIRLDGAFRAGPRPLQAYEREGGRTPQYALWHLAIRVLLREAVVSGAATAARPELSLRRFCERVGRGAPWHVAFQRSFGLPVSEFYARFRRVHSL